MDFIFVVVFLWIIFVVAVSIFANTAKKTGSIHSKRFYQRPVSSDGHRIKRSEDITCANVENHHHRKIPGVEQAPRYIVHEDPETGYVILNGVKRRLTDCKYL